MAVETREYCQYFASYSGVKLPLNLVSPIAAEALANRNTFIRAYFDAAGALIGFDKVVYGEVELAHRYRYDGNGVLRRAEIVMLDEEAIILQFDADGAPAPQADAALGA
jgi:hypothetical protein